MYMDSAYAPYGEQYAVAGSNWAVFAGTQQNVTVGTYDADFRRYSPAQGRWLSPDPAGLGAVDLTNPQSLNRYAYVRNNPTSLVDPSGLGPRRIPQNSAQHDRSLQQRAVIPPAPCW
jgi:RHS repeat-associated protein